MKQVRILVAEDNEDHLFLTIRAIRQAGGTTVEVEGVRDGQEALDYVHRRGAFENRERPHVIFLDLRMPKLDGLEVLEEIKSDAELRDIPVVVLTSSDRQEDVDATYRLGGNSFVTKPAGALGSGLHAVAHYWTKLTALPGARS